MQIQQFIQKDNINMLWEVISDEEIFRYLTRDLQESVYQLFLNNIQGFFNIEKIKTNSLVDLNKKYILLILNHIKKNYNIQPNKIKIHNEPIKENITFEEIQNNRLSKFEKDLNDRREEFDQFANIKPPPTPDFTDKDVDGPIKEMDKMLKEMQSQRKYEIEQINHSYNASSEVDNWLKPQETSLKPNKTNENKKNVSFNDINQIISSEVNDDEDINIFSKLKKNNGDNIKFELKEFDNKNKFTELERQINDLKKELNQLIDEKLNKILFLFNSQN